MLRCECDYSMIEEHWELIHDLVSICTLLGLLVYLVCVCSFVREVRILKGFLSHCSFLESAVLC